MHAHKTLEILERTDFSDRDCHPENYSRPSNRSYFGFWGSKLENRDLLPQMATAQGVKFKSKP